jgi:threonine aldolase
MADHDQDRIRSIQRSCTRFLRGHGPMPPAELLAALPDPIEPDSYGTGGVVAELEREVAAVLGKAGAVFLPSGTMAQQIALRVHSDRSGRRTVVLHPTSHPVLHEDGAAQRLHGLHLRPVGDSRRLLELADLEAVAELPAALLLELPQRELGGLLPDWDELGAQLSWAARRGAATHLDGARLWECTPHYQRSPAEICAGFDTVYVSFYKGLGGISGCCLAGEHDIIAEAREWRQRHGGTLFALWPYAASALAALRTRLPRMPDYLAHARAVAEALAGLDGVEVAPDPPVVPMLHLYLRGSPQTLREIALRRAQETGIWTWAGVAATDLPGRGVVELTVGDATMGFAPEEVREVIAGLLRG